MNKPIKQVDCLMGRGAHLTAIAKMRKGQAFKSPIHPNKRAGTVKGDCVSCGRLTMAHRVRGSHGIAAWSTVERKLDAGRNRDRPIKNRQSVGLARYNRVYKRRIGSEGYGTRLYNWRHAGVQNALCRWEVELCLSLGIPPKVMKGFREMEETKAEGLSLIGALAKALPELESAKKTRNNPAFKSKYADLAAVIEAIEPVKEHGLWYRQHSHESADGVKVETFYIHTSGEQLSAGSLFMPATKKDAQGFGSALSYARRYALQLAFGLATEDDDGNAASKPRQNDDQQAAIVKIISLCEAVGDDQVSKVCKAYKVKDIRELTSTQAKAVIDRLTDKLAEKAKATTNAEREFSEITEDLCPF